MGMLALHGEAEGDLLGLMWEGTPDYLVVLGHVTGEVFVEAVRQYYEPYPSCLEPPRHSLGHWRAQLEDDAGCEHLDADAWVFDECGPDDDGADPVTIADRRLGEHGGMD